MADFDDYLEESRNEVRFNLGKGDRTNPAAVMLRHGSGATPENEVRLVQDGALTIVDGNGEPVATLAAGRGGVVLSLGRGGSRGEPLVLLDGSSADAIIGGTDNAPGDLVVRDGRNTNAFAVDGGAAAVSVGAAGNGASLEAVASTGEAAWSLDTDADILAPDTPDSAVMRIGTADRAGRIEVHDHNDNETIRIDGRTGDIRFFNADLAEQFTYSAAVAEIAPGTVVEIDDAGEVRPCSEPASTKVVGVVAGAGEYQPALVLDSRDCQRSVPIAVVGKVRCQADATERPISVGDLLVSSAIEGHACAAADRVGAVGAILGKALTPLESGTGTVRMLVSLQ